MSPSRKKPASGKSRSRKGAEPPGAEELTAEPGSVDKIRDILFGSQMQDYDQRFAQLEKRLAEQVNRLGDDSSKRIQGLESFLKRRFEAFDERLKSERGDRGEGDRELGRELKKLGRSLEKKVEQLAGQSSASEQDLQQNLLEQSQTLSTEIRQKHEESAEALRAAVQELSQAKVDRSALASLFVQLAMQLDQDLAAQVKSTGKGR